MLEGRGLFGDATVEWFSWSDPSMEASWEGMDQKLELVGEDY